MGFCPVVFIHQKKRKSKNNSKKIIKIYCNSIKSYNFAMSIDQKECALVIINKDV